MDRRAAVKRAKARDHQVANNEIFVIYLSANFACLMSD
jgi:hypothetical protein